MQHVAIAIDGPAASGKSSVARPRSPALRVLLRQFGGHVPGIYVVGPGKRTGSGQHHRSHCAARQNRFSMRLTGGRLGHPDQWPERNRTTTESRRRQCRSFDHRRDCGGPPGFGRGATGLQGKGRFGHGRPGHRHRGAGGHPVQILPGRILRSARPAPPGPGN